MKHGFLCVLFAVAILPALAAGQQNLEVAAAPDVPRTADHHPDLSGTWLFAIDLPPVALKEKQPDGKVVIKQIDTSARLPAKVPIPGALPFTAEPSYKPEFEAKVKYLLDNESKTDQVFYCGKPGIPRIGPPRKIVQLPKEMIFLYEDISGDPYRIIPTDGRAHRADGNPSYYGDSVGHYEGDTLVVDTIGMNDKTATDRFGTPHTKAIHVIERYRIVNDGKTLQDIFTVEDLGAFTTPWSGVLNYRRARVPKVEEEVCAENNRGLAVPEASVDAISGRRFRTTNEAR